MSRQLRPRKSRPDYRALLYVDGDDDVQAGPSSKRQIIEEEDSGSDFSLKDAGSDAVADEKDDEMSIAPESVADEREGMDVDEEKESIAFSTARSQKKSSLPLSGPSTSSGPPAAPGLARASNRQNHALPQVLPHGSHRHRSIPLFQRTEKVERLSTRPEPFSSYETVLTNSGTANEKLINRTNKALSANVGSGPIWDMLEDRAWFKEAHHGAIGYTEAERRPRVYEQIAVSDDLQVLTPESAQAYLPGFTGATESTAEIHQSLTYLFGPHDNQRAVSLKMFEGIPMSNFFEGSNSHVFNAGGPVWALDWCPISADDRQV